MGLSMHPWVSPPGVWPSSPSKWWRKRLWLGLPARREQKELTPSTRRHAILKKACPQVEAFNHSPTCWAFEPDWLSGRETSTCRTSWSSRPTKEGRGRSTWQFIVQRYRLSKGLRPTRTPASTAPPITSPRAYLQQSLSPSAPSLAVKRKCTRHVKSCCIAQGAIASPLWWNVTEEAMRKRMCVWIHVYMHIHNWATLQHSRNWRNIVNQLQ